jgi:hypothetical protein
MEPTSSQSHKKKRKHSTISETKNIKFDKPRRKKSRTDSSPQSTISSDDQSESQKRPLWKKIIVDQDILSYGEGGFFSLEELEGEMFVNDPSIFVCDILQSQNEDSSLNQKSSNNTTNQLVEHNEEKTNENQKAPCCSEPSSPLQTNIKDDISSENQPKIKQKANNICSKEMRQLQISGTLYCIKNNLPLFLHFIKTNLICIPIFSNIYSKKKQRKKKHCLPLKCQHGWSLILSLIFA